MAVWTESNEKVPRKPGHGSFVEQTPNEANTKTIAGSRPVNAKRVPKEPVRYKLESERLKRKAVEVKEEGDPVIDGHPVEKGKKCKAPELDQEEVPASPKKKSKLSEPVIIDEPDEIDQQDHIPKAKKSKTSRKATKQAE